MPKITIVISLFWLLLSVALFYAVMILNLSMNMFSWSLNFEMPIIILSIVILVIIFANIKLAQYTLGKFEIGFSMLIASAMAIFGFFVLYDFYTEFVSSAFLGRNALSPHWFRILIFAIYLTPIICWLLYPYKTLKKKSYHGKIY